ncbi:fatty acyl-CoA hydrolase precursor, medium chain-like isoform X1 [Pseudophryne corroboree]|uniref:fatty acyl-CoA hydrolase precursor, medium chain-like isoform X1 n=1 Tax=Pseudophryne corroboree TaxID=495146 RepID=UPI0030818FC2
MGFGCIQVFVLGLFTGAVLGTAPEDERPLVGTQYGKLRGVTVTIKETSRTVDAFFGIPFAKPPLRFASPEPPVPWDSIRDASEYPPVCIQQKDSIEGWIAHYNTPFQLPRVSEDCLYLNVFTPSDRARNAPLPVMVFIHGGGLVTGLASMYDGSALSSYEDVVFVSIQYRLGILGFFSTGDGQLHGNYGLLDQVAALQWIQENIADFGGDPQSVTIFGESAGGASVSAHVLSPLSKGLFHRAIAESGVMTMSALVVSKDEDLIVYRNIVAHLSGCDPASVAECLKRKSEQEILSVTALMGFLPLPVCVDGVFLPKPAEEILADKESNKVPLLLGVNNQEFGWILPQLLNVTLITEEIHRELLPLALGTIPILGLDASGIPFVMDEYFGGTKDPSELRDQLIDACGDVLMVIPVLKAAKYHRDSGLPVYFYEFQHRSSMFQDTKPDYVKADHTDELIYVMGGPYLRNGVVFAGDATDEEKALSRTIMRYWANFARNGDPNGPGLAEWPLYNIDEEYLEINKKQKTSKRLKEDKFKFWTEILNEKIRALSGERGDHTEL